MIISGMVMLSRMIFVMTSTRKNSVKETEWLVSTQCCYQMAECSLYHTQLLRTLDMWYSFLDRIWWMKSNIFQAQVAYSDGPICDFPYKSTLGYKVPSLYDVAS